MSSPSNNHQQTQSTSIVQGDSEGRGQAHDAVTGNVQPRVPPGDPSLRPESPHYETGIGDGFDDLGLRVPRVRIAFHHDIPYMSGDSWCGDLGHEAFVDEAGVLAALRDDYRYRYARWQQEALIKAGLRCVGSRK